MRTSFKVTLAAVLAFGCADQPTAPGAPNDAAPVVEPTMNSSVVHHVSVGAEDPFCEATGQPPGCDANFSLVANQRADGTVTGQWQDTFGFGGGDGLHVAIDCLNVVGNGAVIGGVITRGSALGTDFTGLRTLTAAIDNGSSVSDPLDQVSFSWVVTGPTGLPIEDTPCTEFDPSDFILLDVTHGQVKVQ
jgi:hypothetical protein